MQQNELSKFTHEELSSFTHEELSMIPADLFQKILDDDRPLPQSVVKKIQELSKSLPDNAPQQKKLNSFKDALEIVVKIGTFIKLTHDLTELFSPKVQEIIEAIASYFC